jgi:hypothetical protein
VYPNLYAVAAVFDKTHCENSRKIHTTQKWYLVVFGVFWLFSLWAWAERRLGEKMRVKQMWGKKMLGQKDMGQ